MEYSCPDVSAMRSLEEEAFMDPIAILLEVSDIVRFALHVTLGEIRLNPSDNNSEAQEPVIKTASRTQQDHTRAFFNRLLEKKSPVKMITDVRPRNIRLCYKDKEEFRKREVMVIEAKIGVHERQMAIE